MNDDPPSAAAEENESSPDGTDGAEGFFVVGVGASAGGLQAFMELLGGLPAELPMAIVLVQHLDPVHPSELAELLGRATRLPVVWLADRTRVEPRRVYVLPPNRRVRVHQGVLLMEERTSEGAPTVIDGFFHSLAEEYKDRAIGVVLSGSGSDGALGLRTIRAAGGLSFVQETSSASFPSMPRSAIDVGDVDCILPPGGIAAELLRLTQSTTRIWGQLSPTESAASRDEASIAAIFRVLNHRTGVDFSDYKQSTIMRRVARRMAITKTENLADYAKLLVKSREEVTALHEGMLINVTDFFRDEEYWDYLAETVLPEIIARRRDRQAIRLWIPGCSTGQEAYSYSMLIAEALERSGTHLPVQIFGTDVSDRAINTARAGTYSPGEVARVSPERLQRFFTHTEQGFVVTKSIRDLCIFARQNITKDSPFSRLDLVSCRNLLIYLGPSLQRKLMPMFHYALSPESYLVLGNSESVGPHADLFRLLDRRYRIYVRKPSQRRTTFDFTVDHLVSGLAAPKKVDPNMPEETKDSFDVLREADRVVLGRHAPPGILVNEDMEILQFRGNVAPFISPLPGRASLNLTKMAREGLASELQGAVLQAREENTRVRRTGLTLFNEGQPRHLELDVTPIDSANTRERFYLILFVEAAAAATPPATSHAPATASASLDAPTETGRFQQLKQDLDVTRSYLQTTIEKHEATNQELRAANEEIQSSNEELQSTNEELETAKEELQSTNEELTTVNEELHNRQLELIQLNNDLHNLINSVHLPIIILGQDMRIRRFTPMTEKVLNVIPTDVGRPLSDLNLNLNITDLPRLMAEVMDSLTIRELEAQDNRGRWYSLRLRPYKTAENKIDGVVMTLIDIDDMKRTLAEVQEARNFAQAMVETTEEPLLAVDQALQIRVSNEAFRRLFGTTREQTENRPLSEVARALWDLPDLRDELAAVLPEGKNVRNFPAEIVLPGAGHQRLSIDARQIVGTTKAYAWILISLRPQPAAKT